MSQQVIHKKKTVDELSTAFSTSKLRVKYGVHLDSIYTQFGEQIATVAKGFAGELVKRWNKGGK